MNNLTRKDLTTIFFLLFGNPAHAKILKKIRAMIDEIDKEED